MTITYHLWVQSADGAQAEMVAATSEETEIARIAHVRWPKLQALPTMLLGPWDETGHRMLWIWPDYESYEQDMRAFIARDPKSSFRFVCGVVDATGAGPAQVREEVAKLLRDAGGGQVN